MFLFHILFQSTGFSTGYGPSVCKREIENSHSTNGRETRSFCSEFFGAQSLQKYQCATGCSGKNQNDTRTFLNLQKIFFWTNLIEF